MAFIRTRQDAIKSRSAFNAWSKAHDRLAPEVWPELSPRFTVDANAEIFTIGSCFARNIEEHLHRLGYNVPMLRFSVPNVEWPARANGILNKYTPPAISQELAWTAGNIEHDLRDFEQSCEWLKYDCGDGRYVDLSLGGFVPVSEERFYERRREIFDVFKHAFQADCVTITLGYIEAWYDKLHGKYIQKAPIERFFLKSKDDIERFEFHQLDCAESLAFVRDSVELLRRLNPKCRVLMTTSPVSLAKTFTESDVITANLYSKSVLRAVCGQIYNEFDFVDYFPSFESAMLTKSWDIWDADRIHVKDYFVGKIVSRLIASYFPSVTEDRKQFQEAAIMEKSGSAADARELAREAFNSQPDNLDYRLYLVKLLMQQGGHRKALRLLSEVTPQYHDNIQFLLALARAQLRCGHKRKALKMLEDAIARGLKSADLSAVAGEIAGRLGLKDKLQAHFERATELSPQSAHIFRRYGVALDRMGDLETAVEAARKGASIRPHVATIRAFYARMLIKLGDEKAAQEEIIASEQLKPPPDDLPELKQLLDELKATKRERANAS